METTIEYVDRIEFNHIFEKINQVFEIDKPKFIYSKDNMQTLAVTIHPHFTVWLCALQLYNIGGETMKSNAIDEVFGSDTENEGSHSMLALSTFRQLGEYKLEHYERCKSSIAQVYKYVNKKGINVLFSFLICCELASFIFIELEKSMKENNVKDLFYFDVHLQADNLEDGHGIKMLKELENNKNNISTKEINQGIQLFRDFFLSIFSNK